MKVVIMAGGRGTRISSVASDIPKPMIKIDGMPVLEKEIECLRTQGYTEIIITVGHLGHVIMDYFGDGNNISEVTGRPFGVSISYYQEETPLGNAGALFRIRDQLTDDFLLLNADVLFDVDFNRFVEYHKTCGGLVTLFTHPNTHPYDSAVVVADSNRCVIRWISKEDERPMYYKNRVNAGLHILSTKVLDEYVKSCNGILPEKIDLDRMLLKPYAGTGKMFCYDSPEYVKDMGTPERYQAVCNDEKRGLISSKNLNKCQKAIFLDRDGTLNKYVGFLRKTEELELLEGVEKAVGMINQSGYLAIVVTNQPVIARGEVTEDELCEIHNKLEFLLGEEGVYIDGLYYCPHHPDNGFEGEIQSLKVRCECRKPKPGMLYRAAEDFNINLSESWMVGDSENDIMAGKAAGCKTGLILGDDLQDKDADVTGRSLLDIVEQILCKQEMTDTWSVLKS